MSRPLLLTYHHFQPLLLWLFLTFAPWVQGDPLYEPLESISDAAYAFLLQQFADSGSRTQIEMGQLDTRLKLQRCENALEAFLPDGFSIQSSTATVGVRCVGVKPWTIFVRATVKRLETVVVALRPLTRGDVIARSDISLAERDITLLHGGYFMTPDEVIGQEVTRTIIADMVVSQAMVKLPLLIKKGDEVIIVARTSGLSVKMRGKSLMDGEKGATIRVMNLSSKREVSAVVVDRGEVEVRM
ncbi:MAG: flagellar basal body P-ring formation protein FlgA [Gammaproteobacteria bacterium]|nr:flagellar basal body P-ring formation protein FlgA [Gammaproteobacteria bacterium]